MKKIIRVAGLAWIVALVPAAAGWAYGPERTTYTNASPATTVTFNSITDNTGIGDERNFVRVREKGSLKFDDAVTVTAGKTYEVYIYYHNNAASNLKLTALNTRAYAYFPSYVSKDHIGRVGATISADNATPARVWDEASLVSTDAVGVRMKYVENSAVVHQENGGGVNGLKLTEDLFKVGGTLIGYDKLDGKLPGCAEYSGYITFEIVAEQAVASLEKSVVAINNQAYRDGMTATIGDVVTYKLVAKNKGNVDLKDVTAWDDLVEGLEAVDKAEFAGNVENAEVTILNGFFTNGQNVGELRQGGVGWTITYKAKITDKALGGASCGENKLVNTGYIAYKLAGEAGRGAEISNQAAVTVKVACPEEVVEMPKTGADAGEMLMTMAIVIATMGGTFYIVHGVRMMRREEQMEQLQ